MEQSKESHTKDSLVFIKHELHIDLVYHRQNQIHKHTKGVPKETPLERADF